MKSKHVLSVILTIICLPLMATTFWSNFMHSQDLGVALNHESSVKLFCDFDDSLTANRQIMYRDGAVISSADLMTHSTVYLPSLTAELLFNGTNPINIGFKANNIDGETQLAPVKFTGTAPGIDALTPCSPDPVGDAAFTSTFLDIVSNRVSFDVARLYIAIENNGGGFPTSQNFTFYSYMGVLSEPSNHDPDQTVYGLMYTVTQAGIISPGLYKITGTGITDLERIGDITVQMPAGTNDLILSCLWSDLMADADFSSWYANAQSFGFMTMTQRITLTGGTVEADRTTGATIYATNEVYTPAINQLPVIYNPWPIEILPDPTPGCMLTIRYHDANDDVPLQAEAIFDGIHEFNFIHMSSSNNSELYFETDFDVTPIYYSNWHSLTYRFWYTNTDYVDTTVVNTEIQDPIVPATQLTCNVYPNPFAREVNIHINNPKTERVDISIYNMKGQLVKHLHNGILGKGTQDYVWSTACTDKASGMYFLKVKVGDEVITKKMIRIN